MVSRGPTSQPYSDATLYLMFVQLFWWVISLSTFTTHGKGHSAIHSYRVCYLEHQSSSTWPEKKTNQRHYAYQEKTHDVPLYSAVKKYFCYFCLFVTLNGFRSSYIKDCFHDHFIYCRRKIVSPLGKKNYP